MSRSHRARLIRVPRQDHETHVFNNPLYNQDQMETFSSLITTNVSQTSNDREIYNDYQAPLTSHSLRPNSRWLIVRRNLHRIRFMGYSDMDKQGRLPDIYLGLQMVRELKRAQEEIKNIDKEENFQVIKQFALTADSGRKKKFDISHIKPDDALIYDRLGDEPLVLQNLFYYFSKQDVQHGTVFWNFLNEVNHVLNLKRKRSVLVQRLRRLALTSAIVSYSIIGLMFLSLIISVIATVTKTNDPEVGWLNPNNEEYSRNILSFR